MLVELRPFGAGNLLGLTIPVKRLPFNTTCILSNPLCELGHGKGVNLYDRFGGVHESRLVQERLNVRYQIKDFFNFEAILTKPRNGAFDPRQTKRLPISAHFVLNVF